MGGDLASALRIDDLSRRYGRRWALIHLQVEVQPGDAWMVLGPNGSGKSTLLKCLSTALKPHHGHMFLAGEDLWANRARLRRRIAVLGHQAHVYDDLSAAENLQVWSQLGGYAPDIPALLQRVGLDPARRDPVRTFSAGMRRRIALARMLLKQPDLVLLDEPFTALDPAGRQLLLNVVRSLQEDGATLMMATHLPAVAAEVCTHTLMLEGGKMVYQGPTSDAPLEGIGT